MQSMQYSSPTEFLATFNQLTSQTDRCEFLEVFIPTKLNAQDFYAFFKNTPDPLTIRDTRFWVMNRLIMLDALKELAASIQIAKEFLLIFSFFQFIPSDKYTARILAKSKTKMMDSLTEQQLEIIAKTIKNDQDFLDVLVILNGYPFKQATVAEVFAAQIKTIDQLESLFKELFEYNLPEKQLAEIVKLIFNSLEVNSLGCLMSNSGKLALFLEKFNARQSSIIFEGLPTGYLVFAFFGGKTPTKAALPHEAHLIEPAVAPHPQQNHLSR